MRLVVGLGNPGKEYENTRHNVGYMFLDYVTKQAKFKVNRKFKAMEYETSMADEHVMFIKPLTFMNLTGEAILKYVNFYKIKPEAILIIQDDLDMPIGTFKLLFNHGDGGHNGIKNVVLNLGRRDFLRLKIGISKAAIDTKEYVLGSFTNEENRVLREVFTKLDDFMQDYVMMNRDMLMGKYNSKEDNK